MSLQINRLCNQKGRGQYNAQPRSKHSEKKWFFSILIVGCKVDAAKQAKLTDLFWQLYRRNDYLGANDLKLSFPFQNKSHCTKTILRLKYLNGWLVHWWLTIMFYLNQNLNVPYLDISYLPTYLDYSWPTPPFLSYEVNWAGKGLYLSVHAN